MQFFITPAKDHFIGAANLPWENSPNGPFNQEGPANGNKEYGAKGHNLLLRNGSGAPSGEGRVVLADYQDSQGSQNPVTTHRSNLL